MKKTLLLIALSMLFVACTSSATTDKSTEYKNEDQKYGSTDWREVKDSDKLMVGKTSVMSAKPKIVNKEKEFIDEYMKNLEKNLLLTYKEFNETPHKGWRVYFESKDYVSAHKLIDAYISKHKESLSEEQIKSLTKNSNDIKALLNKK